MRTISFGSGGRWRLVVDHVGQFLHLYNAKIAFALCCNQSMIGVAVWFVSPDINLPRASADDRRRLLASPEGVKGLDHLQTVPAENSV